jgi:hypothetical protein
MIASRSTRQQAAIIRPQKPSQGSHLLHKIIKHTRYTDLLVVFDLHHAGWFSGHCPISTSPRGGRGTSLFSQRCPISTCNYDLGLFSGRSTSIIIYLHCLSLACKYNKVTNLSVSLQADSVPGEEEIHQSVFPCTFSACIWTRILQLASS